MQQDNAVKLSSRRIEVMTLVKQGKTNPEIAGELRCSLNTITSVRRMVRQEAAGASWVPREMTKKQKRIAAALTQGKSNRWITSNLRCSGGNIVDVRARMTATTVTTTATKTATAKVTKTPATAKATKTATAATTKAPAATTKAPAATTKAVKGEGRGKKGETVVISRAYLEALEIVTASFVDALKHKSVIDVFLSTFKARA